VVVKLYHRVMRRIRAQDLGINLEIAVPLGLLTFMWWRWLG